MKQDFRQCSAYDTNLAQFLASCIASLDSSNQTLALRRTVLGSQNEITKLDVFPADGALPDMAIIQSDSTNYVVLSGVRNFNNHMRPLTLSYLDGPQEFGVGPVNAHLQYVAGIVIGLVNLNIIVRGCPTFIAGHSYGGAIAKLVTKRMSRDPSYGNVRGMSFGAPKVGDQDFELNWPVGRFHRHMNDADPVPLVFPSSVQAPQFHTIIPVVESAKADSFVQGGDGTEWFSNGTCRDASLPSRASAFPQTTILQWLYGLTEPVMNDHSISTYLERISAYILAHPSAPDEPNLPPAAPVDQAVQPQQRDEVIASARNEALAMMRDAAAGNPAGESAPRIRLVKEGPFRIGESDVGAMITTDNGQKVKRFRRHMYALWKMSRGVSVIDWDAVKDYMG